MKFIANAILNILTLSIGIYVALAYGLYPLGQHLHPEMALTFNAHQTVTYTHIMCSVIALVMGPIQFIKNIRINNKRIHRWIGRIYLFIGVFVGGLSGLYMAQHAFGGYVSQIGFTLLAVYWLYTGYKAFSAIKHNKITAHKKWMVRNFSLTFAAVTLRIYLGGFTASGIAFETFYPWLSWLCWIPNLIVAEFIIFKMIEKKTKARMLEAQ